MISFFASVVPLLAQDGGISEYRNNYVPQVFTPLPEFMVFVDLGIFILLMILGACFVVKSKSARPVKIVSGVALVYLGLLRGGCICPVGVITNVTLGLSNPQLVGLATLILFLVPMIMALIMGRIFCTSACPLGAVQHLFYKRKKHIQLPDKVNAILKIIPVILLLATIYMALSYSYFLVCKLEPYKVLFFVGGSWTRQLISLISGQSVEMQILWAGGFLAWIYVLAALVIGYWIPRPFCRLLCPYGVLLGVVSIFSFKKRGINKEKCVYCGACKKACPVQAIQLDKANGIAKVSGYSCVQCNVCTQACKKGAIQMGNVIQEEIK